MKIEEPRTMQEIHRIQVQIHEEMKDLSKEERHKRVNANARKFAQKYNLGIKFVSKS
jgi:hypothetical protein